MNAFRAILLLSISLLYFSGCDKKPITTELREVHWDRDMCERCKMVVSDRQHAIQVIDPKSGKSYMFDDIGCAILWFDDEKIAWRDSAKIWITDAKTGKWLDARTALYDSHNITPMAYGFTAHKDKDSIKSGEKVLHFNDLPKLIRDIEQKNNTRGVRQ